MKVRMIPTLDDFKDYESGIKQVCAAYQRYAPKYGIQYVKQSDECDLMAVHAGMISKFDNIVPLVSHCHGLYWTADYESENWEYAANRNVIKSIQYAETVTVPSEWVAETLRRDMHLDPIVVPHGIEWQEWQIPEAESGGYVLWNKNRSVDVCDPVAIRFLAKDHPNIEFYTTFAPDKSPQNVFEIGLVPHEQMRRIIGDAGVYLSTTKETFGIGVLEALAAGIPVLGFAHGGNLISVQHGVNGYLAKPGNFAELSHGLEYCLKHRKTLSDNARETAKQWTWDKAMAIVVEAYTTALTQWNLRKRPHTIDKSLYTVMTNGE